VAARTQRRGGARGVGLGAGHQQPHAVTLSCELSIRHGRACPGHPRLCRSKTGKTWMPGTQTSLRSLRQA
jgi:hypothetical protein